MKCEECGKPLIFTLLSDEAKAAYKEFKYFHHDANGLHDIVERMLIRHMKLQRRSMEDFDTIMSLQKQIETLEEQLLHHFEVFENVKQLFVPNPIGDKPKKLKRVKLPY